MKNTKSNKWAKSNKKKSHERRKTTANLSVREAVGKARAPAEQRKTTSYDTKKFAVEEIQAVGARRPVNAKTVHGLMTSIQEIGLRTPLMVRVLDGVPHLVAGLQRLAAVKALGWKKVPCVCTYGGEIYARKCKVAENLHRGELTKLERAEETAEWVRLTEDDDSEKTPKNKRGRPESGNAKAARKLPLRGKTVEATRKSVERDLKIAGIDPAAKKAAIKAGLGDDAAKLLKIAAEVTPKAQLAKVGELKNGKPDPRASGESASDGVPPFEVLEREWKKAKSLRAAWKGASPSDRTRFVKKVLKYTVKKA